MNAINTPCLFILFLITTIFRNKNYDNYVISSELPLFVYIETLLVVLINVNFK